MNYKEKAYDEAIKQLRMHAPLIWQRCGFFLGSQSALLIFYCNRTRQMPFLEPIVICMMGIVVSIVWLRITTQGRDIQREWRKKVIKLEKQFKITPDSLILEIGFGGGEHLAEMAKREAKSGFLGAEPFQNGVASLLAHLNGSHDTGTGKLELEKGRTDNVRIWPGDIRELFEKFPEGVFKRIYLLYPDPWPNKRHAERRFINTYNIPHLYRLLMENGELVLATDVAPYVEWTLEKMAEAGLFYQTKRNIHTPPRGWISTRYEKKGIAAGRQPTYLIFKKKQKMKKKLDVGKKMRHDRII